MPASADDDPQRGDLGVRPDSDGRTERLLFELRCIEVSTRAALQTFDDDDHVRRSAVVERGLLLLARLRRRTGELGDAGGQARIQALIDEARRGLRSQRMG